MTAAISRPYTRSSSFGSTESSSSTINVSLPKLPMFLDLSKHSKKQNKDRRRSTVSFNKSLNQVHKFERVSKKEQSSVWYNDEDFQKSLNKLIPLVNLMSSGAQIPETDTQTTRGLEYRTVDGAKLRKTNKLSAIDAVLNEQDNQLDNGKKLDFGRISKVYTKYSLPCAKAAYEQGLKDEAEAKLICKPVKSSKKSAAKRTKSMPSSSTTTLRRSSSKSSSAESSNSNNKVKFVERVRISI